MAASLSIFTKEEQRIVVCSLQAEGVKRGEINKRLSTEYGDDVLYQWVEMFKNVRTD
jgi:hypothetical protein